MELSELCIDIDCFIENPYLTIDLIGSLLHDPEIKVKIGRCVRKAVECNFKVYKDLFFS